MKSFPFLLFLTLLLTGLGRTSRAQVPEAAALSMEDVRELVSARGILANSVSNLHAEGGTLWAGPFLSVTSDGGETWAYAASDSLLGSRNRVYSLDIEGDVIWVGLGYTRPRTGTTTVSMRRAAFWSRPMAARVSNTASPNSTPPVPMPAAFGHGPLRRSPVLPALKVVVPEQSPPWDIDYDPATGHVWMAGFASGIRLSTDDGRTWQRVVLPPDGVEAIRPDEVVRLRHRAQARARTASTTTWASACS